ncbi:MAG: BatD family protein [Thermodesulfobacteriota bacterium]
MKRLVFLASFLVLTALSAAAAHTANVSASVDRTRITDGETLTLTVTIEGGKGEVNVGGIRDFEVASRGTSSSYNMINGNVSSQTAYIFTLVPLKKGHLVIPPLPVETGGKTVYTEMIPVEVGDSPRAGGGADTETADAFTQLSVSGDSPFVGEQITCRFSLYNAVPIANAAVSKAPDFPGFSAEKLTDNRSYSKIVNGRRFDVTELVYVLTPEQAGVHVIGPATISCDLVVRTAPRSRSRFDSFFNDPFFGGGQSLQPRRLTADPVTVNVRPLPEYKGAEPFSGLVGEFSIAAEIGQTELAEGDSCNIAVVISGRGNIKSAAAPRFDFPAAFKVYEDTPTEDVTVGETGVSGKKRFPAALVAVSPGKYTVGPFSLTYFDVKRNAYATISTAPIDITVKPGGKRQPDAVAGDNSSDGEKMSPPVRKQAVEFTGHDIFPVKPDLSALEHARPVPLTLFLLMTGGPFVLYGLAAAVMSRVRRKTGDATLMSRRSRAALKEARRDRLTAEARLDLLFKAVVYAVYARAGRKGESLTYREARQLLTDNGCDETIAEKSSRLLEEIEQARYGGRAVDQDFMTRTLASAGTLIRRIVP